jgi:hypothetical protein
MCRKEFTLLQTVGVNKEETLCTACGSKEVRPKPSTFSSKVQGAPRHGTKPATVDDYPNKDVFKLPIPRLRSDL